MKIHPVIAAAALLMFVGQAKAGTIPYPNKGTIAPTNIFTASVTGTVTGYFVQGGVASAGGAIDLDYVQMLDLTNPSVDQGFLFNNQTTLAGASAFFGDVTKGDVLEFQLLDTSVTSFGGKSYPSGIIDSSVPADSVDGINHAYSAAWAGGTLNGAAIPAGIYVGMEDRPVPGSDLNYNDDSFVFTDVSSSTTPVIPEPSSFYLLGTGMLSLVEVARRKLRRG